MREALPIDSVVHYPDAVSQVRASDGALYWLATIAAEDGRTTVRRLRDGEVVDLTPDASVRSRAMEYGGGAYAVDGSSLAYVDDRTRQVWLRDGNGVRALTQAGTDHVFGGLCLSLDDGVLLAVREDHAVTPEPRTEIVALSLDTDNPDGGTVLATGADFYASIVVSEGRVAWQQWDHPNMNWDSCSVWTASLADPADAAPVASTDGVSAGYPLWLPSGRLAYVADESGFWNWHVQGGPTWPLDRDCARPLWVLNPAAAAVYPDDRIATLCYEDGAGTLAVWSPTSGQVTSPLPGATDIESVAIDGDVLYVVAEWPDRGNSLEAIRPDGSVETVAGAAGSQGDVATAESIWVEGEAGPVQSWLYRPVDVELPPLLVMTHGGPTSMATSGHDATIQFWVSRGFAVLDVNYSGSTGFGRAYRDRLRGQWGLLDVSDTVAAVREVTSRGLADPDRVAITGGSAGGYTTLKSLTSTDVYAAGISRYGIGDLTTLVTDTHKAESRYPEGLIAAWPEGRAVYEERSPINHLDRLSTPMLILQGTEDKVVPPNQAVQMADAVRSAGQPVALLMLEGEGHGFRAMATRRLALEAQVSFLEQVFGLPPSPDVPALEIENL